MASYLLSTPRDRPLLLVYPQVYQGLTAQSSSQTQLPGTIAKCFELANNRPIDPDERQGGYMGLDPHHALYTVWSSNEDVPDIFIIAGWGDGFGPGESCPTEKELLAGHYGPLIQVPFMP